MSAIQMKGRDIRIDPIPTKVIKVEKAVKHGDHISLIDAKGRIYSTAIRERLYYSLGTQTGFRFEHLFGALQKLGVLTTGEVRAHRAAVKAAAETAERRSAARYVRENAERAGIKLTATQLRAIAKATGEEPQ